VILINEADKTLFTFPSSKHKTELTERQGNQVNTEQ